MMLLPCRPANSGTRSRSASSVLDATISQFHRARPGIRGVDERITATGNVMVATLTVALYVRELTTRPADVTAAVTSSLN